MPELILGLKDLEQKIIEGQAFLLMEPIFDDKRNVLMGTERVLTAKDVDKIRTRVPSAIDKALRVRTTIPHFIAEDLRIKWCAYLISLFEGGEPFKNLPRNTKDFVTKYLKATLSENDYVLWKLSQLKAFSKKIFLHSVNTAFIALIGYYTYNNFNLQGMLDGIMIDRIMTAGFLHDIGFMKFEARIAEKKRVEIPDNEMHRYLQHPIMSFKIIESEKEKHELDKTVFDMILNHEEHIDGSGGPRGLGADGMEFPVRLLSIANYFELLLGGDWSVRPRTNREHMGKLRTSKTVFDEKIVEALDVSFNHLSQD